MNIDLSLNEYGVDSTELARITAKNILGQIGLRVVPDDIQIMDLDLFQSKIPEIIKDTKFTVNDYEYTPKKAQVNHTTDNDLSDTELILRLFFSRPEYSELETPYEIHEMTPDGRFVYSNGKTSDYDHNLIEYIYHNLLEYYSSYYDLEDIQLDLENNYGHVSLYVLSRILSSIEARVYQKFGFQCNQYEESMISSRLVEEIKILESMFEDAPLNLLCIKMKDKYNVSPDRVNEALDKLLKKEVITQPKMGNYKTK